jgi:hypothetical protein
MAARARLSFSGLAALYSVIIPLITPVVWFMVLAGSNGYLVLASTVASCLLGTSLMAAVASLIRGHEHRRYFWIAWIGLALSSVLGFFSLVFRSMPICWNERAEVHHAADGSQPFTAVAIRASLAAGSHRWWWSLAKARRMNVFSHLIGWVGLAGLVISFVWGLLMVVDVVRRAKLPKPASFLSLWALCALSLIAVGGMVLLAEEAKRHSGARPAPDGVMFFVFLIAGGVLMFLGAASAAGVLFFRKVREW